MNSILVTNKTPSVSYPNKISSEMAPFLCYGQKAGRLGFAAQKQVFFLGVLGVQEQGLEECPPRRWPRRTFGGWSPTSGTSSGFLGRKWLNVMVVWACPSPSIDRSLSLDWKLFFLLVCD